MEDDEVKNKKIWFKSHKPDCMIFQYHRCTCGYEDYRNKGDIMSRVLEEDLNAIQKPKKP
jgi:hypothetical protein